MIKPKLYILCISLCFCFVTCVSAKTFDIEEFDLDNGMKVLVIPNHKAPIVKHMVWYKVGSVDEPLGKSGKAHLLEHLLFRGTKRVKDGEFNRIIEENGGESNAFTSLDYTAYHQTLDITRLELAMYLEADRMIGLKIGEQALEKERNIVFQERQQVVKNNPFGYFMERLRATLWGEHPYGRPVIGSDSEILGFDLQDVIDFYEKFYTPNNAILVLAGDIDGKTARKLAEKYYGKVKAREVGERQGWTPIDKPYAAKIHMELENIGSPRFVKMYVAPSYNVDKEKLYPLMVLSSWLGGSETSKLYKDLVLGQSVALDVSVSYDGFARSYGVFYINVVPSFGFDVKNVEQLIDKSVKKSLNKLDFEELERIKNKMLAGLVYLRDNPSDAAYAVGGMAAIGMSAEDVDAYEDNIRAVTLEDVKLAAYDLFNNRQSVIGVLTPKEGGDE